MSSAPCITLGYIFHGALSNRGGEVIVGCAPCWQVELDGACPIRRCDFLIGLAKARFNFAIEKMLQRAMRAKRRCVSSPAGDG